MKFLKAIVKQYNKWWNKPSWETSVFESVLQFWIATVYVIAVVVLVFAILDPVIGIFSLAFWLIWG